MKVDRSCNPQQCQRKRFLPPTFLSAKVFKGLPHESLVDASKRFKRREFDRGDILFIEREKARTYFIVDEG
jgi:hypothetical protein